MSKYFYNKQKDVMIVDVSGSKTLEKVKEEFGDNDYEIVEVNNNESCTIVNGSLVKYNYIDQNNQIKADKEAMKQISKDKIKSKLKISDEDIEDLKAILN